MRREYLFKKSNEVQAKSTLERKQGMKRALDRHQQHGGASSAAATLAGEDGQDARKLRKVLNADDKYTETGVLTHVDDEYALAGVRDPRVCITTSHDPSSRLKRFAKEVRLIFPNAQRVNRGNATLTELVETCRTADFTDLIVIHEHRGEPDRLTICHLPYGPTCSFAISNCVMRLDVQNASAAASAYNSTEEQGSASTSTVSEAYPHLVFHGFNTTLGKRVSDILRFLFPVPKPDSKRVMTLYNMNDFVSFRHHVYSWGDKTDDKIGSKRKRPHDNDDVENEHEMTSQTSKSKIVDKREIILQEVGPRFELRPFEIKLGTIDNKDAEVEWVLHSFTNSAKNPKL
jgi:U3 small nucleolar ribonucleoprotein protein IMP4